jgi:hypothetical protein
MKTKSHVLISASLPSTIVTCFALSFVYLYLIEMQHSKNTDCNSERNFGTIALAQFTFEYLLLLGIYKRTIGSKLHSIDGLPRQTIHLVHAETLVAGMRREDREDQEMAEQYMNPHDLQLEMICPNMRAMIFKAEMNQM